MSTPHPENQPEKAAEAVAPLVENSLARSPEVAPPDPLIEWNQRVLDGMNRMSVDDAYRLSINKRSS